MTLLVAQDVSARRGARLALQAVTVGVARGEMLGLVGPNGAGKTTLLRVLARLQEPAEGLVRLDGAPAAEVPRRRYARMVAYLPQGGTSHWSLPVAELVALGRIPHLGRFRGAAPDDREAVRAAMQAMDILGLAGRRADQLSAGELARVLLARALAGEPDVLLADEPVAGLDPYHRLEVMERLRERADRQAAVIVVLHDLTLAARFCDRLALLDRGRLAAEGPPADVLSAENLAAVYEVAAIHGEHGGQRYILPWSRRARAGSGGSA